ncbi:MAG TPA: hypothetical protein VMH39_02490, partial [Gemmatimonadaceae bacterium]|nr:hypothetical protein [Gemmatimonadaceae bacterium]
ALSAFLVAAVGTSLVFHRFFLADDEFAAWFQAVIFAHGSRSATVAPEWCRWIGALAPTSIAVDPGACTWRLSFLPIHSVVRAAFIRLDIDQLGGPATAAASIGLVVLVARKAWPDQPARAWIAAAVLGASTQVLFTSMTMFAMPTHLLFSLIWLWLYLEDRAWSIAVLPWVGFLALGVHSPTPHALFVPPFLLRYVWNRRFRVAGYMAAVYAIAVLYWARQLGAPATPALATLATPAATVAMARSIFAVPNALEGVIAVMHLALIFTWNTPLAPICVLAAMLAWKRLDTFGRDLALSLILVIVVRSLHGLNSQGEGWGYRRLYAALGNFALLAACGTDVFVAAIGGRRTAWLWVSSLATSVLIQLPMRAVQVERVVRPYDLAERWMEQLPTRIVILPAESIRWGRQLVRNDPFLRVGNKIMSESDLGARGLAEVNARYPGQVHVVTPRELTRFGLERSSIHVGSVTIIPR